MKKFVLLIFLHCILPLLIGAVVYVFFRVDFFANVPKILVQQLWIKRFLFTLPDFCWGYSLASALYLFASAFDVPFKKMACLIFILAPGSELVQIFLPQYFTFDVYDLAATVFAIALSTFQMKRLAYENEF